MKAFFESRYFPQKQIKWREGFSLIELLAVIAVIGIIAASAVPSFFSVIRATKLTSAGDIILSKVTQAQQLALTMSSPVELRFYFYAPSDLPGVEKGFRAVQLIDPEYVEPNGGQIAYKALGEAFMLPSGIVMAPSNALSPLLQSPFPLAGDFFVTNDPEAKYCALHFYPDGSFKVITALPPSSAGGASTTGATGAVSPTLAKSFLTVVADQDASASAPKNFVCIQLDAYTSKARLYRP